MYISYSHFAAYKFFCILQTTPATHLCIQPIILFLHSTLCAYLTLDPICCFFCSACSIFSSLVAFVQKYLYFCHLTQTSPPLLFLFFSPGIVFNALLRTILSALPSCPLHFSFYVRLILHSYIVFTHISMTPVSLPASTFLRAFLGSIVSTYFFPNNSHCFNFPCSPQHNFTPFPCRLSS